MDERDDEALVAELESLIAEVAMDEVEEALGEMDEDLAVEYRHPSREDYVDILSRAIDEALPDHALNDRRALLHAKTLINQLLRREMIRQEGLHATISTLRRLAFENQDPLASKVLRALGTLLGRTEIALPL